MQRSNQLKHASILTGPSLNEAIARIARCSTLACAVAFWGHGAVNLIGPLADRRVRLICNLKMGGTNPTVIRSLMRGGAKIRQIDRLHAKLYIGEGRAILTSANASINGLGLEAGESSGWIEIGSDVQVTDAMNWFEAQWKASKAISAKDLDAATDLFRQRMARKPTRLSVGEFYFPEEDCPLISWYEDGNYEYLDENIEKVVGYVNSSVHDRIDNGFDIEHPGDEQFFPAGRWVLEWKITNDGFVDRQADLSWSCSSGDYVAKGFKYPGQLPLDTVLGVAEKRPEPLDVKDRRFKAAFIKLIEETKFKPLRDLSYEGSFYKPRIALMQDFWAELRTRLAKQSKA